MSNPKGNISKRFSGKPILAWAIDTYEVLRAAVKSEGFDYDDYIKRYREGSYKSKKLGELFDKAPFKLNLGGDTDKLKLIATDQPTGVFNFSLASSSLYAIQEYYSDVLAKEKPDRFKEFGLVAGVVPPDLVTQVKVFGKNSFLFIDKDDNGKEYNLKKQKKGQASIDAGVAHAKYKYASKNKKVYQTFNKKGGKVRYVEIYSLFYYAFSGDDYAFAVRHIPAFMVAEYLESIGIKTRIYMTRFVRLNMSRTNLLKQKNKEGVDLPMGNTPLGRSFGDCLFIQPIIAKDYAEEIDKAAAFTISSRSMQSIYGACAKYTMEKELSNNISAYGYPNFEQPQYWEGMERYRNKYQEYVKLGLFEAKEVLPEAMILYHEMSFVKELSDFFDTINSIFGSKNTGNTLLILDVNMFFVWWMKLSANTIKHKINLINSNNYRKDMAALYNDLEDCKFELDNIIKICVTPPSISKTMWASLSGYYRELGYRLLRSFKVVNYANEISLVEYIREITEEITTFADDQFFPTPEEEVIKRLEFKNVMNNEAKNV
jgi:hypothetical protein